MNLQNFKSNNLEEIKKELIDDIQLRKNNGIIEPTNATILEELINAADSVEKAIAIAELGTTYKTTGLHFDKRLEKYTQNVQYLKRDKNLSFTTNKNAITHKLIIGDNYPALLNLLITHRGMIDVIYIDPPYGSDSMGEFAKTNYENGITRDNLLSMLYPRLVLAKDLLSEDGILFCSIDDKNQAYVKCLLDDLFGEINFVATAPRKTSSSVTTKSDHELQKIYDYLLIYMKNKDATLNKNIVGQQKFPYEDNRGKFRIVPLQDNGPHGTRTARPNLYYPIYRTSDGRLVLEKESDNDEIFLPKQHKNDDGRWMWGKKKFISDNRDLIISDKGEVSIKHYYSEGEDTNKYQAYKAWLDGFLNKDGTLLLNSILDKGSFGYPKPIELIEWCIGLCPNENATVLDFFAGSGTTGHAVLEMNKKDNGNRQFILCTNDEKDENGLKIGSDITSKRLKRIMTGTCYDGASNFKWIDKNSPYGDNLEVTRVAEIENMKQDDIDNIVNAIDETIYGLEPFTSILDKVEWICHNFDKTQLHRPPFDINKICLSNKVEP